MKRLLVLLSLITCSSLGFAGTISWNKNLGFNRLNDIAKLLAKAPKGLQKQQDLLMHNMNRHIKVRTCQQYLQAKKRGYFPANNAAMATASFYIEYCEPLAMLAKAKPYKDNAFSHFQLSKDWKSLPNNVVFPGLLGPGKAGSVAKLSPNAAVKVLSENKVKLTGKSLYSVVSWLATGDFLDNGQSQYLINVATYSKQGSFHYYHNVLLAMSPTNTIEMVKTPKGH